jgi:hypothetical protein
MPTDSQAAVRRLASIADWRRWRSRIQGFALSTSLMYLFNVMDLNWSKGRPSAMLFKQAKVA